jgi:ribosomal protein S18 acetylase RimI-like enzyme
MWIEMIDMSMLEEAYTIYNDCRKELTASNILQWTEEYPSMATVEQDIANKYLFGVIIKRRCAGLIVLNQQEAPEYETVNWQDTDGKALVIHRLAVSPLFQRRGVANQLIEFAEIFADNSKFTSIRLDTYSGNPVSVALYLNRGYEKRGTVNFKGRELPFYCLEKAVR